MENQRDIANPRLTDEQIADLEPLSTRHSLADGEAVFKAGERRGGFFIVLEGAVEIIDQSGDEPRRLAYHQAREFTGDIDIMSRRLPVVSAFARGKTELLHIPSRDIRRIIGSQPGLGEVILHAFIARREDLMAQGRAGIRLIGSASSRETFELREFLTRNHVPFYWIDLDTEPGVKDLLESLGVEAEDLPVMTSGTLPMMKRPSLQEVATTIGLRRPLHDKEYDLVIIGSGPAGLAAAVYAASEGLSTLVLERHAPGGQAGTATRIENYLGFPTGITGAELTRRALIQAQKFGALVSSPAEVIRLHLDGSKRFVEINGAERAGARAVLIATGANYRKLDVPGRERFDSVGVYYAATHIELMTCRGEDVIVVGGGNSAGQAAMFLAGQTRSVTVMLRGGDLYKSMSSYLADRILEKKNIEVLYHSEIRAMHGERHLESVEIEDTSNNTKRTLPAAGVFTFIGASPRTDWLPEAIGTDAHGFIRTGAVAATEAFTPSLLETSVPGIFAAGDVRSGSTKRVASAVGEGAMVVKLVHERLAQTTSG